MDINSLKKFLAESHPGKDSVIEFDAKCYRKMEFTFTDGAANVTQHAEFCKAKVTIDGNTFYAPIDPHRVNIPWRDGKNFICGMDNFFVPETAIKTLASLKSQIDADTSEGKSSTLKQKQEFDFTIKQFEDFTGKDQSYLLEIINNFKQEGKNENP
jgi:hypothetical protein